MLRIFLLLFFLQPVSDLLSESVEEGNWFYSKDGVNWKETIVPKNLHEYPMDMEEDEYFLKYRFFLGSSHPNTPLSMRAGIILDREKVWLNDKKIGETGDWDSLHPQGYDKIRIYDLPHEYLISNSNNEILFKIKRYFPDEIGIAQDRIEIGVRSEIWGDFYREEFFKLGFLVIYLTVAVYFIFLFIRRNSEKEYLFFALFALNLVLYQFLRTQTKYLLPLEFWELKKLEYLALPSFIPFMAHFIRYFLKHRYTLFMKLLDSVSLFAFIVIFATNEVLILDQWNRLFIQPVWIGYVLNEFWFIGKKTLKKDRDALLIGIGIVGIILSAVVDIFNARYVWNIPRISGFMFMGNVAFQAFLLANRFVQLNKEVEDLNANLEKKVAHRTEELEESLDKIQKLKVQQDGDYFLTSLLLKSLHSTPNINNVVKIESLTIQKKQFEFRNKSHQIGGDLSFMEEIELDGENYYFFVNSDAMGKSIQGAGGALVLGVLLRSIISRQESMNHRKKFPERWLKDCFLDIQKAFETFDGSMYVSLIMGLVHEKTGYLYYFNAEHPGAVLFRNERAEFLENSSQDCELTIRKIGIEGNEKSFFVNTFPLKTGDILFLGTDGRDDLMIGDTEGNRMMNEDENLFLEAIQKAEGNMDTIMEELKNRGEITDDISLLKITFQPQGFQKRPVSPGYLTYLKKAVKLTKEHKIGEAIFAMEKAYQLHPENAIVCKILGKLQFKIANYQIANEYFQKSYKINPNLEESILWSAYSYKRMGMIKKAIDTAERLRIRNPRNREVISFLQRIYNTHYVPAQPAKSEYLEAA